MTSVWKIFKFSVHDSIKILHLGLKVMHKNCKAGIIKDYYFKASILISSQHKILPKTNS
jgi:hypothetical protein